MRNGCAWACFMLFVILGGVALFGDGLVWLLKVFFGFFDWLDTIFRAMKG